MADVDQIQNNPNKKEKDLTKDDRLDKLLWFKIISSSLFGLIFGTFNFTGFFVFVLYFN